MRTWILALAFALFSHSGTALPLTSQSIALHNADPAAVTQALEQLYGERLRVAQVGDQIVLRGDEATLEAASQLIQQLDSAPRPLRLMISRTPPPPAGGTHYRAGGQRDQWQVQVESGTPVILERSRLQQQLNAAGWDWVSVEERPVDQDSVQLQVFTEGDTVRVIYDYRLRRGQRWQSASATVSGPLGQWLPILGRTNTSNADDRHIKSYSSGGSDLQQLWLRVEPAL